VVRTSAERPLSDLLATERRKTRLPHVLVVEQGRVVGVVPRRRLVQLLRHGDLTGTVAAHALTAYAVVQATATIFDVVARLREMDCDIALVTKDGELQSADDVVGVVTWNDIVMHGNLPLPLRSRRHQRKV